MKGTHVVALTGSKGSGKDTFAKIAGEQWPGEVRAIAVADWFKTLLAAATGMAVASFYDDRKEMPYREPLILNGSLQHHIQEQLDDTHFKFFGGINETKVTRTLRSFQGREFTSNRKLMEWWGFEFIHELFGDDSVHCKILLDRIHGLLSQDPHCRIIIVTDARTYFESRYLADNWGGTTKVRIKSSLEASAEAESDIEAAVNSSEWPVGWFDHTITNERTSNDVYDLSAYSAKVEKVMLAAFSRLPSR